MPQVSDASKGNAIVCITDQNYLGPTKVLLLSLFKYLDTDVDIFVLSQSVTKNDFPEKEFQERVISIMDFGQHESFLKLKDVGYQGTTHVSADAKAKLIIPWLFKAYQRVLYLDVDMICCSEEINVLFQEPLGKNCIAAVPDYKLAFNKFNKNLGLGKSEPYFNSGLVIFDIPACRSILTEQLLLDRASLISPNLRFVDQDTLNYLYRGRVHYLDLRFNVFANVHIGNNVAEALLQVTSTMGPNFLAFADDLLRKAYESKVIFHYTSSAKPWRRRCGDDELWWNYANRLKLEIQKPTSFEPPVSAESIRKNPVIYRLLKIAKSPRAAINRWLRSRNRKIPNKQLKLSKVKVTVSSNQLDDRIERPTKISSALIFDLRWTENLSDFRTELRQTAKRFSFISPPVVWLPSCVSDEAFLQMRADIMPMTSGDKEVDWCFCIICPLPSCLTSSIDQVNDVQEIPIQSLPLASSLAQRSSGKPTPENIKIIRTQVAEAGPKFLKKIPQRRFDPFVSQVYKKAQDNILF